MIKKKENPPRLARWILSLQDHYERNYFITGDCSEEYKQIAQQKGKPSALLWIWGQVFSVMALSLKRSLLFGGTMFINYLKITLRNIKRHKGYSFINIAGLAIGMTCSILILLYVRSELSFEKFHKNAEDIYRIIMHQDGNFKRGTDWLTLSPPILAPTLKEDIPEIINAARFDNGRKLITYKDKKIYEEDFCFVDPEFLEIFKFPLIKGNEKTALNEPFSMLITEYMAEKYFGDEDPVGKVMKIDNRFDFKITGIIENCPKNTHIEYNFLASFVSYEKMWRNIDQFYRWGNNFHNTYLRLHRNTDPNEIEKKLKKYDSTTR